jgi:hypothetical protein
LNAFKFKVGERVLYYRGGREEGFPALIIKVGKGRFLGRFAIRLESGGVKYDLSGSFLQAATTTQTKSAKVAATTGGARASASASPGPAAAEGAKKGLVTEAGDKTDTEEVDDKADHRRAGQGGHTASSTTKKPKTKKPKNSLADILCTQSEPEPERRARIDGTSHVVAAPFPSSSDDNAGKNEEPSSTPAPASLPAAQETEEAVTAIATDAVPASSVSTVVAKSAQALLKGLFATILTPPPSSSPAVVSDAVPKLNAGEEVMAVQTPMVVAALSTTTLPFDDTTIGGAGKGSKSNPIRTIQEEPSVVVPPSSGAAAAAEGEALHSDDVVEDQGGGLDDGDGGDDEQEEEWRRRQHRELEEAAAAFEGEPAAMSTATAGAPVVRELVEAGATASNDYMTTFSGQIMTTFSGQILDSTSTEGADDTETDGPSDDVATSSVVQAPTEFSSSSKAVGNASAGDTHEPRNVDGNGNATAKAGNVDAVAAKKKKKGRKTTFERMAAAAEVAAARVGSSKRKRGPPVAFDPNLPPKHSQLEENGPVPASTNAPVPVPPNKRAESQRKRREEEKKLKMLKVKLLTDSQPEEKRRKSGATAAVLSPRKPKKSQPEEKLKLKAKTPPKVSVSATPTLVSSRKREAPVAFDPSLPPTDSQLEEKRRKSGAATTTAPSPRKREAAPAAFNPRLPPKNVQLVEEKPKSKAKTPPKVPAITTPAVVSSRKREAPVAFDPSLPPTDSQLEEKDQFWRKTSVTTTVLSSRKREAPKAFDPSLPPKDSQLEEKLKPKAKTPPKDSKHFWVTK